MYELFVYFAVGIFFLGYYFGRSSAKDEIKKLQQRLNQQPPAPSPTIQPQQPATQQPPTVYPQSQAPAAAAATHPTVHGVPQSKSQSHVDNAVLLLYFGAFLFLSSVGLFLAFGGLGGTVKSALVAIMVAVFYAGGLWLYRTSKRLKPAGLTFVGIGMVLLPFFGLALHSYVFDREMGPAVWAFTSILAVGMYIHALLATRQAFVTYFMLGAVLSLFESGVAITELPVYYFAWVMALTGIVFMLVARYKGMWQDVQESLVTSSNVLVPVALLFTVLFAPAHGLFQVSLGFLLGAGYYWLAAYLATDEKEQSQIIAVADSLTLITAALFTYQQTEDMHTVAVVTMFAVGVQLVMLGLFRSALRRQKELVLKALGVVTAFAGIFAVTFSLGDSTLFTVLLSLLVAVFAILYWLQRGAGYVVGALLSTLILPFTIGLYVADPAWDTALYVVVYAAIATVMFVLRSLLSSESEGTASAIKTMFYITLCVVGLSALIDGLIASAIIAILLSASFISLSYFEAEKERRGLFVLGLGLQHIAMVFTAFALTTNGAEEQRQFLVPIMLGVLALVQYSAAYFNVVVTAGRLRYLRNAAIYAAFFGAASVVLFAESNIFMVLNLILASVLLYIEADRKEDQDQREVALGVAVIALQWLLYLAEVRVFQVYTHIWAVFFAFLALWRNGMGQIEKEKSYTTIALAVLTVPLALQALGDQGEFYGWLLIIEQVTLMLLGMIIARPFITRWGLWVAVAAVLYQLRELTFVAVGFLAVVLIVIALRVLQKNNDQEG